MNVDAERPFWVRAMMDTDGVISVLSWMVELPPGGASDITVNAIILLYVGGFVGLVVMVVGLIMAAVGSLTKQRSKPS